MQEVTAVGSVGMEGSGEQGNHFTVTNPTAEYSIAYSNQVMQLQYVSAIECQVALVITYCYTNVTKLQEVGDNEDERESKDHS